MFEQALRRGRDVFLVILGVVLVSLASASAADWNHVGNPDVGKLLKDPAYVRSAAAAQQAYESQMAIRATASQRRLRAASASKYRHLSAAASQDLAQRAFPALLQSDLDTVELPSGVEVHRWLSPTVGQLVDPQGKGSLLVGTEPLATDDGSGSLHRLDLSLASHDDMYAPRDPAQGSDVMIPHAANDFLTLQKSGVGLKPAGAPATTGLQQNDRVFYPDVAQDTDYIAMPTRTGAEVMWQLRSAQAADALPLDVHLPAGAAVRLAAGLTAPVGQGVADSGAGAEIVRDGTVLATIEAPKAFDADGVPVAASYRLDGDRLTVDVDHRDADVKYPVVVDPEVHEVYGGGDLQSQCSGWQRQAWGTYIAQPCYDSRYGGGGLYNESTPGVLYADSSYAAWSWGTPNYVHIISVWMDGMWARTVGSHFFAGVTSIYGWEIPGLYNNYGDMMNDNYTIAGGPGYNMDAFQFGLQLDCCWNSNGHSDPRPYEGLAAINGVNIRIGDDYAPTPQVSWMNIPTSGPAAYGMNAGATQWVSSQAPSNSILDASDAGLGIHSIGLAHIVPSSAFNLYSGTDDYIVGSRGVSCTGTRASPCPNSYDANNVQFDFSSFNGVQGFHSFAFDITDNVGHGSPFYLKLDRWAPNVSFSGEIGDARNGGYPVGPNPAVHVQVTDGSTISLDQYQSGVRSVTTKLDGNSLPSWSNANPDATNNDYGWDYNFSALAAGSHTLTITATDDVGHATTSSIPFTVVANPTSWQYGGADHVVNTDAEAQAVVTAYQSAGTDSSASKIYAGLAPGDRAIVDAKMRSTIGDRQLARVATTGSYYYVEDGIGSQFTSTSLIADAGLDPSTAKRISAGAESGYQQGPAITSSSFDAGDGPFAEDPDQATSASADWHFKGAGTFDFFTSDGIAVAAGGVKWWNGNSLWTSQTRRGETTHGSALSATSSVGCIWAKASYTAPRYTFSIPGPGASMANETQSNGFIYHCRSGSQTRPNPINLAGFGAAKFWLGTITLTICTSATASDGPRYCSNHQNKYPGGDS